MVKEQKQSVHMNEITITSDMNDSVHTDFENKKNANGSSSVKNVLYEAGKSIHTHSHDIHTYTHTHTHKHTQLLSQKS